MAIFLAECPMARDGNEKDMRTMSMFYDTRYGIVGNKNHKKKNKTNLPNAKIFLTQKHPRLYLFQQTSHGHLIRLKPRNGDE